MTNLEAAEELQALKRGIDSDKYNFQVALNKGIEALENSAEKESLPQGYIKLSDAINVLKAGYWDKDLQSAKDDPCIVDAMIDWAIRQISSISTSGEEQKK